MSKVDKSIGSQYKTRSGITASNQEVVYNITTNDAKKFLQSKFNLLTEKVRERGKQINNQKLMDRRDIRINLVSYPAGNLFLPFILLLPEESLKSASKTEGPEIFNTDSSNKIEFKDEYWDLIKTYMFDEKDINAMKSVEWRRRSKVTEKGAKLMRQYLRPKKANFNGNRTVIVIIDPIRVFHDMLDIDDMKDRYVVNPKKWTKIDNGSYNFEVHRKLENNTKKDIGVIDYLNYTLRNEAFNK